MTNRPFRPLNYDRDIKSIERIWIECGWIDDDEDDRKITAGFFRHGFTEVATIDDQPECAVHWTPGRVQYQEESLPMAAVSAVTTSHIARQQGFARELTARALARQFKDGFLVSALGMFDQGFYNKLGFGTGPYEVLVHFDPATLTVNSGFRPPKRLTADDYKAVHHALIHRRKNHGATDLLPPESVLAEMKWTEKPFGLGYFDGPDNSLSHFIWGNMKDEHGPYEITARAYQNDQQLLELLALIRSLGDQVNSMNMLEFGDFQVQDLLKQPFRTRRSTQGSKHEQIHQSLAYWQLRILNLQACLAQTHFTAGPGVKFNLSLHDPLGEILGNEVSWQGISGDYVVALGSECSATPGRDKNLPDLRASVSAFSRLWFGVRPASHLAFSDNLEGSPGLIKALDELIRLPTPHFGWDF